MIESETLNSSADIERLEDNQTVGVMDSDFASTATIEARMTETLEAAANLTTNLGSDMGNIALAPDELETLHDLVIRYDQVVQDLDVLNKQIESLLAAEGIKGCES